MRGDVTVRAECLMPEKLLARVAAQGVPLSAVRRPALAEGENRHISQCAESRQGIGASQAA